LFLLILNAHRNRLDSIDSGEHPDFVLVAFLTFTLPLLPTAKLT